MEINSFSIAISPIEYNEQVKITSVEILQKGEKVGEVGVVGGSSGINQPTSTASTTQPDDNFSPSRPYPASVSGFISPSPSSLISPSHLSASTRTVTGGGSAGGISIGGIGTGGINTGVTGLSRDDISAALARIETNAMAEVFAFLVENIHATLIQSNTA